MFLRTRVAPPVLPRPPGEQELDAWLTVLRDASYSVHRSESGGRRSPAASSLDLILLSRSAAISRYFGSSVPRSLLRLGNHLKYHG